MKCKLKWNLWSRRATRRFSKLSFRYDALSGSSRDIEHWFLFHIQKKMRCYLLDQLHLSTNLGKSWIVRNPSSRCIPHNRTRDEGRQNARLSSDKLWRSSIPFDTARRRSLCPSSSSVLSSSPRSSSSSACSGACKVDTPTHAHRKKRQDIKHFIRCRSLWLSLEHSFVFIFLSRRTWVFLYWIPWWHARKLKSTEAYSR